MFNNIEKNALNDGYFSSYLKSYPDLHKLFHDKRIEAVQTRSNREIPYWNALNSLAYMVFENLRFLYLQLKEKSGHNVHSHLPTFMSTFMMGFPVAEYLRRMMCILSEENFVIDKNRFGNIILGMKKYGEREFAEVDNFLQTAVNYPGCANIANEWANFSKVNDIRHTYTHAFRLPWWHRKDTQVYGFPRTLYSDPNKIKDEIWEFVKDAKAWENKVSSLSDTNFISGADLIEEMHRDGAKMANTLFLSFKEHINRQATET